ncbi:unnamed protein product [Arabidopsis thaliana]|uniref:Uncharacterized protein n=1 Tax=Arabidopsis thaliana TaxID=3702 RepID=A0A654FKL1_ARATH|nr:unnamed protein product [Arabidopsis thaliana]
MAPLESPATASSSEVESSSEEISKSSSAESKPKDPVTVPSSKTLKSPSAAVNSKTDSSDDSEKQSFVLTRRKKKEGAAESPAVKSGKKRAGEGSTSRDMHVKRVKKEDDNKKPNPQRVWSEEDEISLLQAVIDFKAETGTSPWDHKNAFFDIAKKSISFDVSHVQFFDKIRRLKNKYFVNRKNKSGESNHDKKCLGLAVLIWGSDGMNVESPVKKDESILVKGKANSKEKKVEKPLVIEDEQVILGADSEWFEESFLVPFIANLGLDEYSVKKKWSKVSLETKKRIQEKMKVVDAKKCELLLAEMDVLKDVTSVLAQTN